MPLQFPQIVKRLLFPRQTPVGRTAPHEQHPGADRTPARSGEQALRETVERNQAAQTKDDRRNDGRSD